MMEKNTRRPRSFGLLLFPQFEVLDMAGPIEVLISLSRTKGFEDMSFSIISRDMNPVSHGPAPPDETSRNFAGKHLYLPTYMLETAPQLDVLIVPGVMVHLISVQTVPRRI